jgi:hypothetical protein
MQLLDVSAWRAATEWGSQCFAVLTARCCTLRCARAYKFKYEVAASLEMAYAGTSHLNINTTGMQG